MKAIRPIHRVALALPLLYAVTAYAEPKVDEQVVGPVVQDAKYIVSPQGTHLATVGRKGSRMMVTVDGVAGPKVDEVVTPVLAFIDPRPYTSTSGSEAPPPQPQPQAVTFSKDGKHYAYIARVGQEWLLLEDNKEVLRLPAAGMVGGTAGIGAIAGNTDVRLQFAGDDGKHLFFGKSGYAGFELWVDGQKMPGYYASGGSGEGTVDPLIYANGDHFAYLAKMGTRPEDKRVLIIDGKEAEYLGENLQVTADGHLVSISREKEGDRLLVDGKSLFKARQILAVHVAPAGHRIFRCSGIRIRTAALASSCWWMANRPKRRCARPSSRWSSAPTANAGPQPAGAPAPNGSSPTARRPGVPVHRADRRQPYPRAVLLARFLHVVYVAHAASKSFVVTDEDESDAYDSSPLFRFMPDGKGLLTYGQQAQAWVLSLDGKVTRLPPRTYVQMDSFTWSPDHSHYAYNVGFAARGEVYEDGKTTGLSGTFSFSPDSKHLAVVGSRAADAKAGLFVDGELAYAMVQSIAYHAFSPDSQHLFWMSLEPVTTPNPVDAFEWVTYADGKAVAHHDRSPAAQALLFPHGFGQFATTPPAWSVNPDGVLHLLTPSAEGIKHIKATPGSDTSLARVLEAANKGAEKKGASGK